MRSDYVSPENFARILPRLQPANALACRLALQTGLRIGDCLALEQSRLNIRPTVIEQKTGRRRRVYVGKRLLRELQQFCRPGRRYVFPHRLDDQKHRTRQAVFLDIRKACRELDIEVHISPHSFRKAYAVKLFRRTGSLAEVQRRMGHSKMETTVLYALADQIK